MTRRIVLGNDGVGWTGLRVTQPGFDAIAVTPSEVEKLVFDSEWDRIERVHQAGSFVTLSTLQGDGGGGIRPWAIPFPTLSYIPIVTVRRKSASGTVIADEWWTLGSGGDDQYKNYFFTDVRANYFTVTSEPFEFAKGPISDSVALPWYFDYVVWKLPINA